MTVGLHRSAPWGSHPIVAAIGNATRSTVIEEAPYTLVLSAAMGVLAQVARKESGYEHTFSLSADRQTCDNCERDLVEKVISIIWWVTGTSEIVQAIRN